MNNPRITVVVICYNQEQVICRCIDSILSQKDFGLKEIIISDDSSSDNTWRIIQKYKEDYPKLIMANQNLINKGIYGNLAKAYELVTNTDLIITCSGDDTICYGFFNQLCQYVKEHHLNGINDSFVIYGDFKVITPTNKEFVIKNNILLSKGNAIDFRLRHLLSNRSSAVSLKCFKRFERIPYEKSVSMAEEFCDIQQVFHSEKNYYIPFIGSIYYSGIGISRKMNNIKDREERIEAWSKIMEQFQISFRTKHSMLFDINRLKFANKKSISIFFKTWYHFILSGRIFSIKQLKYMAKEITLMILTPYKSVVC